VGIAPAISKGAFCPSFPQLLARRCIRFSSFTPFCLRIESPRISMRCALCTKRSRIPSADEDHPYRMFAFSTAGGQGVPLCRTICTGGWDSREANLFLNFLQGGEKTYFLQMGTHGELPKLPKDGFTDGRELNGLPGVRRIDDWVESAISPDVYSFTRMANRRNLFRVPIP
jgi:hypothetical protein